MPRGGGGSARGYKPGQVHLREGSRPQQALATLVAASAACAHALTLTEWRTAHLTRTGDDLPDLDSIAHRLRNRGFVTPVGGRTGALQYAAVAAPQPPAGGDLYEITTAVVAAECMRTDAAVPLEVIVPALAARGVTLTSDQTSTLLLALTQTSIHRAVADHVPARLECELARHANDGRLRRFWRPVGSAYAPAVEMFASRSARRRAAAYAVHDALGRAVSPLEIRTWALAHPDAPEAADVIAKGDTVVRFSNALRTDLRRARDREGDLRDVSHRLAPDGGLPLRIAPRDVAPAALATARLTDACAWLRPAEEMAAVAGLRDEAAWSRTDALRMLADIRESAAAGALLRDLVDIGVDPARDPHVVPELVRRTEHAASRLHEWWRAASIARYPRAPRWLADAEATASVARDLGRLLRSATLSIVPSPLTLVGQGGLRSYAEVEGWLRAVLTPEGRPFQTAQPYLHAVRRFPSPERAIALPSGLSPRGRASRDTGVSYSALDVGDALRVLADLTSRATLAVTLARAADLLGYVVRDPSPLLDFLACLPAHDGYHRRAAAVALGALGHLVGPDRVLANGRDEDGLDAYALALGLAPISGDERRRRLADIPVEGLLLRSWQQELVRRAAEGDTITIAMRA